MHKEALLPFLMPGRSCRSRSCLLKFKNTRYDQPSYPVNDTSTGDPRLGCPGLSTYVQDDFSDIKRARRRINRQLRSNIFMTKGWEGTIL